MRSCGDFSACLWRCGGITITQIQQQGRQGGERLNSRGSAPPHSIVEHALAQTNAANKHEQSQFARRPCLKWMQQRLPPHSYPSHCGLTQSQSFSFLPFFFSLLHTFNRCSLRCAQLFRFLCNSWKFVIKQSFFCSSNFQTDRLCDRWHWPCFQFVVLSSTQI